MCRFTLNLSLLGAILRDNYLHKLHEKGEDQYIFGTNVQSPGSGVPGALALSAYRVTSALARVSQIPQRCLMYRISVSRADPSAMNEKKLLEALLQ